MNFRQVGKKIRSVSNVKQITRAMQMVSSVKMKKAQEEALAGREYRRMLGLILSRVLARADTTVVPYTNRPNAPKKLYVLISSNKGLCGSFNLNLFKKAMGEIDFASADFVTLGKKSSDFVVKSGSPMVADFSHQMPLLDNASPIFALVSREFLAGTYSAVYLVYNTFISTLRLEPTIKPLMPVRHLAGALGEEDYEGGPSTREYLIEPSPREVLQALVADFLEDEVRDAILNSEAAEHSARMMAMKNATDNAAELIYSLTLVRNKLRQTQITNELLDITTAKTSTEVRN